MKPIRKTCPACGGDATGDGDLFRCPKCGGVFDASPDEGGTYSDRDPAARLMREERARERKLDRLGRRK